MTQNEIYLIGLLIGQVVPPTLDYINKWVSSAKLRFLLSLGVCGAVGILLNINNLKTGNLEQVLATGLVLWTSAQGAYNLYYKGSAVQNNIRFSNSVLPRPI
jgi:hypothetical protein